MDIEAVVAEVDSTETVSLWAGAGHDAGNVWTNVTGTPFILEEVDIGHLSHSSTDSGSVNLQGYIFYFYNGDTSSSGGLSRQWNGHLVVQPEQEVGWATNSGDALASFYVILTGRWQLTFRPGF